MGLSPTRVVRSERAADEFFQCYQTPPCPTNPRSRRSKLAANVIPIPADGFMEGIWESSPAAPRWPSTTAFRASCRKSASDRKLLVGFSDDRRFFVQFLVLLVFFVLVIIIVGMSRRHRVTADDGDDAPNVVRGLWSHFRLLCGCRVSWRC